MTVFDAYTRKSTVDNGRSVAGQETEIREWLTIEGHQIGRVFSDPDLSASRFATKKRPDYDALLAHLKSTPNTGLVLWESSRGSRNLSEWIALLEVCRDNAIPIAVKTHGRIYDVRRRRDWRTLAEDGVDSHDESEKISERVTRGKRILSMQGVPTGKLTFGYRREYSDRGEYLGQVESETDGPIVREIIQRIIDGDTIASIARDLTARGIPTPRGAKLWHPPVVSKLAANPAYAARCVYRGEVVADGKWPALVEPDTFDACVEILSDPQRRTQQGTLLKWLLSGVPQCGHCRTVLRPHAMTSRGVKSHLYSCQSCARIHVVAHHVDRLVTAMVLARLREIDQVALFAPPSTDIELAAARRDEKLLRARLQEHVSLSAKGKLSAAMLAGVEAELSPMIDAAAAKARALARPKALRDLAGTDVVADWEELSVAKKRDIIRALCEVHVGPGERGRPFFDPARLGRSKFHEDTETWGEKWAREGLVADGLPD